MIKLYKDRLNKDNGNDNKNHYDGNGTNNDENHKDYNNRKYKPTDAKTKARCSREVYLIYRLLLEFLVFLLSHKD